MDDIKANIANNLTRLRKEHKLTQLELAEKINYSDKAISRWEKGEVTPDITILCSLCDLYNVDINDLLKKHTDNKVLTKQYRFEMKNKLIISLLSTLLVWFIATIIYVYEYLLFNISLWKVFIWAVPISCIVGIVFNAIWGKRSWMFVIITILIWSLLASIYIQFLPVYNLFLIFLLGAPGQVAITLWSFLKPKNKR